MTAALWKWAAIACLGVILAATIVIALLMAGDLKTRTAERDAATKSAAAWQQTYQESQRLALATEQAHAAEHQAVTIIREAATTAKQGIAHAPGADTSFDFSDAAYGFLRPAPPQVDAGQPGAPKAPPGVVRP